jgi:tRNA modification GTPase
VNTSQLPPNTQLARSVSIDTIAAIATPPGRGGIGIIRLSGIEAFSIADRLFHPARPDAPCHVARPVYGHIRNPDDLALMDEVLLSRMRAPHSYTCEDVVEINTHASRAVLESILRQVLDLGARLAEPGEFTRRAFLNGRIDLSQAEAVSELINAQSERAARMATNNLSGELCDQIEAVCQRLAAIEARIETAIDFIEDCDDATIPSDLTSRVRADVIEPLQHLVVQYEREHLFREGAVVAIVGKPNVGKSSLLNALLKSERAIVTEIPGTTRDMIEETILIGQIPVLLVDTAGLRPPKDPVEAIGIEKTRQRVTTADMVVMMVDASAPLTTADFNVFAAVKRQEPLIVYNKIDLCHDAMAVKPPPEWASLPSVKISAKYLNGLQRMEKKISDCLNGTAVLETNPGPVPNFRQKNAILEALTCAQALARGLEEAMPLEMVVVECREARQALALVIGAVSNDSLLDDIFNKFCIGK